MDSRILMEGQWRRRLEWAMRGRRWATLTGCALAAALTLFSVAEAGFLADTDTDCASTCDRHSLETFGLYEFKGHTRPADTRDRITFWFKKAGTNEWHRFGAYDPSGTWPAFKSATRSRDSAVKEGGTWKLLFIPYKQGRWVLKAEYPRQGDYARSAVLWRVNVSYGE